MGAYGSDGHTECVGDLLVGSLLLMIEDEDGSLDVAEALEMLFDGLLKLALLDLLLGVAVGVGEALLPAGGVEAEEDVLGEVVEMLAAAGEAQEGAEDHVLMVAYHLLEGEIGVQAGLDHRVLLKFHACQ